MFSVIFAVLPLALVAVIVYRGVAAFQKAEGPVLDRLWATSKDSATWFVGKVIWAGGWVIVGADNLAQLLGQDSVGAFIVQHLPPQWAGWGLLVIAVTVWLARFRTLIGR